MPETNPWSYWLQDFPRAEYGALIPGGTPSFTDYWRNQYGNVYGDWQTKLGQMVLGGQAPSLGFGDFLGNYPFAEQYNLLSPRQRGYMQPRNLQWRV